MCGRYVVTTPGEVLAELFELDEKPHLTPRYNVAPTQEVAIVRWRQEGGRELALVHWGLVPFWAKERAIGSRLINARAESISQKPSFRDSFKKRRCLIPADGFYEWQKADGRKQPWLVRLRGGEPFAFAGLWSSWQDRESDGTLESCTIVTTTPNELAKRIHDRMPVILPWERHATWLDPAAASDTLQALLVPYPVDEMEAFPVSTWVNSPAHEEPRCVEPLAGHL
ncbi:MAG TPA: SOS response-associated peptidase [Thermoanaerobaculia bacterium]